VNVEKDYWVTIRHLSSLADKSFRVRPDYSSPGLQLIDWVAMDKYQRNLTYVAYHQIIKTLPSLAKDSGVSVVTSSCRRRLITLSI